ncbi:DUF4826 family protein [Permianibacter aggregans]|uniref:Uncharacterized protein DUF4826 n=1 Tax=Permianibacter aggregans TaxID=1510150 RepID=A0A4R6UTK0_9GAMM|nr:DUF4826 family protein [Permianibacter aggregans]QGX38681.1 DUF4826 family protein [Permianibacter aggregans]TDQ50472.1 uncharacterized protein DUF4826 [Permianibacter aggregans]
MSQQQNAAPSQEEVERRSREWVQKEYARALTHLANMGIQQVGVTQSESRVLPPLVALWRCHGKLDGKNTELWVVTGQDIPVDHIAVSAANNARDAMRNLFMNWQLKAARLEQGLAANRLELGSAELQQNYIKSLITAAERLAQLVETPTLWPEFQKA